MRQITKLNATTELEAVNAMLAALGEAPLADLASVTQPDFVTAINTLRDAVREVCDMGWRFNTEFGFQLVPALTFAYLDRSGETTGLNVFTEPPRLLKFSVSEFPEQLWPKLDLVLRPARKLVVTVSNAGEEDQTISQVADLTVSGSVSPRIFYDRALNRDGLDSGRYDFLYIDPVWAFDFEDMPEVARRFCLVLAMRRWLAAQAPSVTVVGFTDNDQKLALRNLKVEQGMEDEYTIMDNTDVQSVRGGRPSAPGQPLTDVRRRSPGPA
jgi:Tail tubular protein